MKPSDRLQIESCSKRFIEALTSKRFGVIAELTAAVPGGLTEADVREQVAGLTADGEIENAYFEIVSGETDAEPTVHICFDVGLESEMIALRFARENEQVRIQDVEWGYPD
jgi:hypothetical protein